MKVEIMTKNQINKYIKEEIDMREKRYIDLINKLWKKIVALEIRLDIKTKKINFLVRNEI